MWLAFLACASKPLPDTGSAPDLPITDPHGVPEDHVFSSYEGQVQWSWAWDVDPTITACELVWRTVSTEASNCPDCDWSFNVAFTYQPDQSHDNAGCLDALPSPNFTWSIGLINNYAGYNIPTLMIYDTYYYSWRPTFAVGWNYPNLTWGGGYMDDTYSYHALNYYYTNYWYGTATVQ